MNATMNEQKMYPPARGPLREHQARWHTLQHTLPLPLHSQLHTQQHPLLQPLHPWLRVQAFLACLTLPMDRNHSLLSHVWHIQSANLWPVALPTLVSMSRHHVTNVTPFLGPLLVCALLQCLPIPC